MYHRKSIIFCIDRNDKIFNTAIIICIPAVIRIVVIVSVKLAGTSLTVISPAQPPFTAPIAQSSVTVLTELTVITSLDSVSVLQDM